jgi:hypothetical protein
VVLIEAELALSSFQKGLPTIRVHRTQVQHEVPLGRVRHGGTCEQAKE